MRRELGTVRGRDLSQSPRRAWTTTRTSSVERFPFEKYDQLFVPEFNAGAMENVGAVTFHDRFLFRDPPTYAQRLLRGEVVLHELAHMWFGNLVTMRWWDDLWLNETFATYLSYRCLTEATAFQRCLAGLQRGHATGGASPGPAATTHPVATRVEDTDQAVGNFDAITYEKGAAVIKQLVAAIGDAPFRAGMRLYFDRHAWGNATLADFLGALGDAAGRRPRRVGGVLASIRLAEHDRRHLGGEDGRVSSMELRQTAPHDHPVLRPHTTVVGLVSQPHGGWPARRRCHPGSHRRSRAGAAGGRGSAHASLRLSQSWRPRLRPRAARPGLGRLRPGPAAGPARRAASATGLVDALGDGPGCRPVVHGLTSRRCGGSRRMNRTRPCVQAILDRRRSVLRRYVPDDLAAPAEAALTDDGPRRRAHHVATVATHLGARCCRDSPRGLRTSSRCSTSSTAPGRLPDFEPDQELRWQLAIKAAAHGRADADADWTRASPRSVGPRPARPHPRRGQPARSPRSRPRRGSASTALATGRTTVRGPRWRASSGSTSARSWRPSVCPSTSMSRRCMPRATTPMPAPMRGRSSPIAGRSAPSWHASGTSRPPWGRTGAAAPPARRDRRRSRSGHPCPRVR